MLNIAFLVAALVLFILSAIGVPTGRVNTMGAGLACLTAAFLVAGRF